MFELIFGNLVIRLLIGGALAVLMAALLITLKNHLQVVSVRRAERRAERALALARALEEESVLEVVTEAPVGKSSRKTPVPAVAPAKPAPAPSAATPVPVAPTPATPGTPRAAGTETAAATTPEGQQASGEAGGAMQDILSSVFGDEEVIGRPEALLAGLNDISSTDLIALATRLANQLNARTATMDGKEI